MTARTILRDPACNEAPGTCDILCEVVTTWPRRYTPGLVTQMVGTACVGSGFDVTKRACSRSIVDTDRATCQTLRLLDQGVPTR